MSKSVTDSAPGAVENAQWTLIRGARQLLTLQGASGPRRGSDMADLNIIPDGAVLIRDGIIEEVGTTRRLDNLVPARLARELDAAGKIVMPAFVDPDIAIATPGAAGDSEETGIRHMSRRRLENQAGITAADLARYGVLTIGAHTLAAPDLQNTLKALRLHQAMQLKPLRLRSIFSPPLDAGGRAAEQDDEHRRRVCETWMPAIFRKKLASLLEIGASAERIVDSRANASAAAVAGFNIRFRVSGPTTADLLELAYSAGAVALIGQIPENSDVTRALGDVGCIHVALAVRVLSGDYASRRSAINDGTPLALASGYRRDGTASMNPQYLLFMACRYLGLTIEEAIVATTYNAACSLRLSHVTGSLARGKSADICVMDVNDYHELERRPGHHDVSMVMRGGKIVYRRPHLTLE